MIRIQRVLVPVDFSEYTEKVIRYGAEISRDRSSKLYFLHVIDQRIIDAAQELNITAYSGDFVKTVNKLVQDREDLLHRQVPQDWIAGIEAEFLIRRGRPADEIIAAAKEQEIDLIILGSRGKSALSSLLVGSVARNVVNHAPCPVLVVKVLERDFIA
jgi:nucleotide-binding universal stress UspA family protein